uniref:Somatolactin alpha n=1 Tax=Erpetoichthys calabaricus TaxID=27687 RepID=A0A8C4TBA2_ERPCA
MQKAFFQVSTWFFVLSQTWGTLGYPLECKDEQGSSNRCISIPLDKLFDRVIQHVELISRVSEECCSLFEEMLVPFPLQPKTSRGVNICITKAIPVPGSKSEIQQISDKWLLHSVLMLVQTWIEPLTYLQETLNRYDDVPDALLNKTKWVSDKLPSLEQGIVLLIKKMLQEGFLMTELQQTLTHFNKQPEVLESTLRDYTLFNCFKKDAHKIETILKLLKCRRNHKLSCLLY